MSRLESVRCERLQVELHTPFVTALRRATSVQTLVVRIVDSDGVTGWGEAPQVWQVTGESIAGAQACVEEMLTPLVVGRDLDDWADVAGLVQRAVARNFGAKAAVDVALHDLVARRSGVTLAELLRGAPLGAPELVVPTDVTVSVGSDAHMRARAVAAVAAGFTTLKLKVGTDAATDVGRVRAVRDAVGEQVGIRLDANQGWSPEAAVEVIRALESAQLGVELVEQPVAGDDVEGMAWVRARVGLPVMADESVYGVRDLERVLRLGSADLVNVKLAKCAGLGVAARLLSIAADAGVGAIVGSMMESHIGVGAAASLVAAFPMELVSDLDAAWWARRSPVLGGLRYDGAALVLPPAPGLGIEGLRGAESPV